MRVSLSSAIYGPDDLRLTENKEIHHKLTYEHIKIHTHTHIHLHTLFLYISTPSTYIKSITYIQSFILVC